MNVSLRAATPSDAAVIAATGCAVWITTYAVESVVPVFATYVLEQFTEKRLREQLLDPARQFWVAEHQRGIVGFAELQLDARSESLADRDQAEVARLYVLERFARRGVGRALLARCAEQAFQHGAAVLWLAAYEKNERALEFYRALGWSRVGECGFLLGGESHRNIVFALRRPSPEMPASIG